MIVYAATACPPSSWVDQREGGGGADAGGRSFLLLRVFRWSVCGSFTMSLYVAPLANRGSHFGVVYAVHCYYNYVFVFDVIIRPTRRTCTSALVDKDCCMRAIDGVVREGAQQ